MSHSELRSGCEDRPDSDCSHRQEFYQSPRLMGTPESYPALISWIVDHGGRFHPDVRFIQGSAARPLTRESLALALASSG